MLINNSSHGSHGTHTTREGKYHREKILLHELIIVHPLSILSNFSWMIAPNQWGRNVKRSKQLSTFIS